MNQAILYNKISVFLLIGLPILNFSSPMFTTSYTSSKLNEGFPTKNILQNEEGLNKDTNCLEANHDKPIPREYDFTFNSAMHASIAPNTVEICNNGTDDDGDGLVDCADSDCYLAANSGDTDNDSDGIGDGCDLDDDNDGILDIDECEACFNTGFKNGGFESPVIGTSTYVIINESTVPGWRTTATDNQIEIWSTGFLGTPSAQGNQFAELNANQVSTLYQEFCLNGKSGVVNWSVKHRGRDGVDVATVSFGPTISNLSVATTMTDGNTAWGTYSGTYTIPTGQMTLVIAFVSVSSANGHISIGNFIEDVRIEIIQGCADTDGDGIIDSRDTDSDNDNCPDAIEGNKSFTFANIQNDRLIGGVGINGVPTAAAGGQLIGVSQNNLASDCIETCSDGLDNNGNGLIDCADPVCNPVITNVVAVAPTCANKTSGQITVTATGNGVFSYSIKNEATWQSSNIFTNLGVGQYTIRVKNNSGNCQVLYSSNPIIFDTPSCSEICNDNMDNDGDGLVDCDDPDCVDVGNATRITDN
jgi:hypothetical protein